MNCRDFFNKNERNIFRFSFTAIVILLIAEIIISVNFREVYIDEFFASYRSLSIFTGQLVPFVNGIFVYPPLVIPTYGLIQFLFGPGVLANRILSSLFFIGILALAFTIVKRLGNKWLALGSMLLLSSNLLLVSNYTTGTLYSLTVLLLMLMTYFEVSKFSQNKKIFYAGLLSGFMILARTNMASVVIIYIVYLIFFKAKFQQVLGYVALTFGVVVVGYLPLLIPNPDVALGHILSPFISYGPYKLLPSSGVIGSVTFLRWLEVLTDFIKEYYGVLSMFVAVSALVFLGRRSAYLNFLRQEREYTFLIISALGLFVAHYFYWHALGSVYYANYFILLFIVATGVGWARFLKDNSVIATFFIVVISLNLVINTFRTDLLSDPRSESDLHRISRGAALVAQTIPTEAKILVFDNSLFHMFLAGRNTYNPLANRDFFFWGSSDTKTVKDLGFYNLEMVNDWAMNDSDYILLHQEMWRLPFLRLPFWGRSTENVPAEADRFVRIIQDRYTLVGTATNVYPRKYTQGNDGGTLLIYKKKKLK